MLSSPSIGEYILAHIGEEHPYLHQLWRESHIHLVHGHMVSGHLQGKLLRMLVHMIQPSLVLEIGTYTGYSALSMASALPHGARIITYEINDELEDFTRPRIEKSPWADRVDFRIADVLVDLPAEMDKATRRLDMVFLDGNKRQYVEYYELSLKYLCPGGFILADNTLWDGHVVDAAYDHDAQTLGVRRFNDLVAADSRVEKVILPLRDGLTLIRKKG